MPLLKDFPFLERYYNRQRKVLALPNGSELWFCYCDHESDLLRYQGREFHDLAIDEVGQWLEAWFQTLRGSNRSSLPGYKARALLTGNPGGVGHKWLKRIFIDRVFNEREEPNDYNFVLATVRDNQALIDNDPEYLKNLLAEPNDALREAFLNANWDVFAGQYFGDFNRSIHVIKAFEIPTWWRRFGAYDHGYFHPYYFGSFACDDDGNVYLCRETGGRGRRLHEIVKEIYDACPEAKSMTIHAGHDCWSSGRDGGPTIAEQMQKGFVLKDLGGRDELFKLSLNKANLDRVQGATQVRNYLSFGFDKKPKFFIFENCKHAIECLPRMLHDPSRPEDVLKVDATETDEWGGDDPYDVIRYGLMSRPPLSVKYQGPAGEGTMDWYLEKAKQMKIKKDLIR